MIETSPEAEATRVPGSLGRNGTPGEGRSALPIAPPPLRVLQVIDSLPQGGAEQLLVTLATHIDRARYDLRVCSLHSLDEDSPVVRALRALGTPIYALGDGRWHDPRHVLAVAGLARAHRIDVLHTHLPYADTVGNLAGLITNRPVVSTLHSVRDARQSPGWIKHRLQVQALRWGARVIIACAPEVGRDARERLRLPARKLTVVPNGIDIEAFAAGDVEGARACRRALLGEHAGPLVVAVGNLLPAKGHEVLVEATPGLLARFPGARVAIVGRGGHNEPLVCARIAALDLGGRVLLAGQRRDIPDVLAAADLFVLSSLWEGLPLAVLEAMAAGTPVVATAIGGVPRVVEDGVTGLLAPAGDADALTRAMLEALGQPDAARQRAAAARAHVRAIYGADAWARRLQSIYSSVAGRR